MLVVRILNFWRLLLKEVVRRFIAGVRGLCGSVFVLFRTPDSRHALGRAGEMVVARFLRRRGCVLLERNYRSDLGEVDIVALDEDTVVFVEVKTRTELDGYRYAPIIDDRQKRRIMHSAFRFISSRGLDPEDVPMRYDLAIVEQAEGQMKLAYYERGAF